MKQSTQNTISRRSAFLGLSAIAALPAWAQTTPINPDVIIIGAGAAGLSAAHMLISKGKSVIILESAPRIGGRAYTENKTFGLPYDHGCSWVMGPSNLPYVNMAREWGYTLLDHNNAGEAFFVDGRRANHEENSQYGKTYSEIESAINQAGRAGKDIAASTVVHNDLPFSSTAQTWIGAMDWAVDLKDLSTKDVWQYGEIGSNYLIKEGYGSLVSRTGGGLPVHVSTPALHVDWGGDGVYVKTVSGTIRAKACIITVSTGVLASGSIGFSPKLPTWKQEAIDDLPMGLLAKVTLQFHKRRFGLYQNQWLSYQVPNKMPAEACYFLTWPFGFNILIGFIGGQFGWNLSRAGEETAVAFALDEVVKIIGSDARKSFVKGHLTDWADNPNTLGAYAAVRPGRYSARAKLARPIAERVFFAGEAVSMPYVQLCGGAFLNGRKVAGDVIKAIT